jgi:hypothetical protein
MGFKIEIIKYPDKKDWLLCKRCTLNTVGKDSYKEPSDTWKHQLLLSEHSPIRTLNFCIKMEIPYYVSVHFCRHFTGVTHFVRSQRNDRQSDYDRTQAPQDTIVSHIMYINAQELMFMARRRLCTQADPTTRQVMQEICKQVISFCPEFEGVLEPMCAYRGGRCTEFNCCGLNKQYTFKED